MQVSITTIASQFGSGRRIEIKRNDTVGLLTADTNGGDRDLAAETLIEEYHVDCETAGLAVTFVCQCPGTTVILP